MSRFAHLLRRRRGVVTLALSVVTALLAAKGGGVLPMGMWDGPG